jgi:CheY-like chemotaxis protein
MEREQAARHRAEATSHLKDEFLALLSHELRTPLGAILVWLGLLRQGGFDPAERERALEIIERSARSLERIIEDLLHASRIAAGGLMLHPQLVDLRSVVQAAVDAAAGDAVLKALSLTWAPGEVPIWVRGDPGRLQQAVSNLLSNAIKFTPARGHFEVFLDTVDQQARLRVADSGEGMSPAFLPFAFERFRQQDSTSTRAHHGLGLGLYVVRHVIGHHGGFVSAESPGPSRGSTFTVLLPLAADHKASPSRTRERDQNGDRPPDGLTVLLVDDEEDAREALRLILQQNGMVVTTAASAREAFDLVERLQPDILLSDVAMPGEDGLSLIRRVRLLPPGGGGLIPAAALSAYAGAGDRRSALLAGFQDHIAKPVDPAHLLAVIARMARKNAGRNE